MTFVSSVHAPAIALRQCVIAMTTVAGSGHPTAAVRLAPLPTLRRYPPLRDAPTSPPHPARARLVFSEGHACPSVYAAAAALGLTIGQDPAHWRPMMRADARRLQAIDSAIDGPPHPAAGGPCFPAAPSSLGQGLARAACLDGGAKRLFCLLGAGASRAGQSWDAVDCLGDDPLQTFCPLFTWHGYGPSGLVRPQHASAGTAAKLRATGFAVQLLDGHTPAWTTICTPDGTPLLSLLQPAEAYAAYALTGAMAEYDGSYYLRTVRPDGPFLYSDATPFPLGGHHVLSQGHTLCRVAAGDRVQEPPQALGLFQGQGLVAPAWLSMRCRLMRAPSWDKGRTSRARC
jgi:transketolase N-terminal domain/subunit